MRKLLVAGMVLAATLGAASGVRAEDYPSHAVTYDIGFPPGGESDRAARFQIPFFKKYTGQDLNLQYVPGAGGATLWSQLKNFKGDGYTLAGTILPHLILQPMNGSPYKTEDIVSVYYFHSTASCLFVAANSPWKTLADAVKAAKASPGTIVAAGTGVYTQHQLAQEEFNALAGIETNYVPYNGTPDATQAMLSGEAQLNWTDNTLELYIDGQLRPLACASEQRHPLFPNTPTFKEQGYDLVTGPYRGVGVPASTPEDLRIKISDIFEKINHDPDAIKQQEAMGLFVQNIPYRDIPAFTAKIKAQVDELLGSIDLKK
jgi:tripartite-type tricarboxylate transporter receptor subunit TctC